MFIQLSILKIRARKNHDLKKNKKNRIFLFKSEFLNLNQIFFI